MKRLTEKKTDSCPNDIDGWVDNEYQPEYQPQGWALTKEELK